MQSLERSPWLLPEPDRKAGLPTRQINRTELGGRMLERGALRFTPAGVPVIDFRLAHDSEQDEAGTLRRVECELACVAVGPPASLLREVPAGTSLIVGGFLSVRSLKLKQPVLHVTQIEFIEDI